MPRSEPTVAVLMSVHAGVPTAFLAEAVRSVVEQSRTPDEFVVVLDGPVSQAHEEVLATVPGLLVVRLDRPSGVATALDRGLAACTSTFVARADSDDVNVPSRLQRQLDVLIATGASVCSAAMIEFESDPPRDLGLRTTPVEHRQFARRMRTRNPVNHPAVVFHRAAAVDAGGYQDVPSLEDYDLWARMMVAGSRFVGVTEPLVRFRADGLHERRTARELDRSELMLQRRLMSYGVVSRPRMWFNLALRGTYRRLPRPVLERVYAQLFRRQQR